MSETGVDIGEWIERVLYGSGGLRDFEDHECPLWEDADRVVAARWVVRCLGNPRCEGARDVVLALMARHGIEPKEKP